MRFAYRKEFATEPLAEALRRRGWETIVTDNPGDTVARGNADVALTSALEYGRHLGVVEYALVPGLAILTRGMAGLIRLVFNTGLVEINSIAARHPESGEAIITAILLTEKHDLRPRIVRMPTEATLSEMLEQADAALLVGDEALFGHEGHAALLDVGDEWEDVTETSFPYMLAWGLVGSVQQEDIDELIAARDEAVLTLADRSSSHPQADDASAFYQRYLRGEITYQLGPDDLKILDVYFRYAFYHSIIQDMPTLKFLPEGTPPGGEGTPEPKKDEGTKK